MREVSFDEYYADQELPDSTKEYVQNWLEGIEPRTDHVYALRYSYRFNPKSETTDYYYLIYIPGGGDVDRRGFGYSTGLFSTAFKMELEGTSGQDGLYCAMTTSKKAAPQLRVTLNGKRLEDEITVVTSPWRWPCPGAATRLLSATGWTLPSTVAAPRPRRSAPR